MHVSVCSLIKKNILLSNAICDTLFRLFSLNKVATNCKYLFACSSVTIDLIDCSYDFIEAFIWTKKEEERNNIFEKNSCKVGYIFEELLYMRYISVLNKFCVPINKTKIGLKNLYLSC